jgi:hypothetical protein
MGIVGPFGDHPFLHLVRSHGQVWFVFMKPLHPVGVYRRAKETWKGGSSLNKGLFQVRLWIHLRSRR